MYIRIELRPGTRDQGSVPHGDTSYLVGPLRIELRYIANRATALPLDEGPIIKQLSRGVNGPNPKSSPLDGKPKHTSSNRVASLPILKALVYATDIESLSILIIVRPLRNGYAPV